MVTVECEQNGLAGFSEMISLNPASPFCSGEDLVKEVMVHAQKSSS